MPFLSFFFVLFFFFVLYFDMIYKVNTFRQILLWLIYLRCNFYSCCAFLYTTVDKYILLATLERGIILFSSNND